MKILNYSFVIFFVFLGFVSCRKDFDFVSASKELRFSEDTIFLDTVFNQVRSQTYFLKIYNQEDKDISIDRIALENGIKSYYKINIDGFSGSELTNVPLRKKDSLYIFIELATSNLANESIVEEKLFVETPYKKQFVTLFSVAEDVEFYKPNSGNAYKIETNTVWDDSKPKLIFEDLLITNKAKLTIEEGTKIYFHRKGKLIIDSEASFEVNGTKEKEVIFRGDRHDIYYDTLYGNWQNILLKNKAKAKLNYAKIQGGTYGIIAEENVDLELKNSKILNQDRIGIYAINAKINAENVVFNHCGEVCFAGNSGNYNFLHSTFANFSTHRLSPFSIYLTNSFDKNNQLENADLISNFGNCIVYSNKTQNSIQSKITSLAKSNILFENSLIQIQETENPQYKNCVFNQNPMFKDAKMSKNLLSLLTNSPAKGIGNILIANQVPKDILGKNRTVNPNAGGYQD